jgi:hypothetical protein
VILPWCHRTFLTGIFATLVTDSHSELLDPKTFLLFSEKQRMELKRKAFMRYIFNEVHVPLKSVTLGLQILDESKDISSTDRETVNMVIDSSHLIQGNGITIFYFVIDI